MKKFELTNEFITNMFGTKLFRIRALVEFGDVEAGELGGYVEKESNLGHDDNAWVYGLSLIHISMRLEMDRTDMPDVLALRLINFSCTKKHFPGVLAPGRNIVSSSYII